MTAWRVEVTLIVLGVALSSGATRRAVRAGQMSSGARSTVPAIVVSAPAPDVDSLYDQALAAARRNPFRLSRTPSEVPYTPRSFARLNVPSAPAFRGALILRGIIGGPPWQALIDGLPGQAPGTLVRAGSTFDNLSVRSVGRDTVVIQAPDTVWRLTLSRGGE